MSADGGRSIEQIEADIATTRERLADTIDQLAYRAQPKQIARRQARSAQDALTEATRNPDGSLRTERITVALAATAVVLLAIGLLRRRLS